MSESTLSVAAIEKGTVIDHIPVGQAMRLVLLLKLADHAKPVTLGLNLPSRSMGFKDLIKVEGLTLSEEEAALVAIFAPQASINVIDNFKLRKKFKAAVPSEVKNLLACPSEKCITRHEGVLTRFRVYPKTLKLECIYCERTYSQNSL